MTDTDTRLDAPLQATKNECSAASASDDHTNAQPPDRTVQSPSAATAAASAHSDCDQSQSSTSWDHHARRSSFRQSTKQRTQHSPRWRDQQEHKLHIDADSFALNEDKAAAALPSLLRDSHKTSIHSPAFSSHLHSNLMLHEHNDSASQTSHTYSDNAEAYSHHSSYDHHHSFEHHESSPSMSHKKFHVNVVAHVDPLMHNETRFPTAGYAASEAAKSDIATVCSGSVIEDIDRDIDMASVASGEYNVHERFALKRSGLGGSGGSKDPHQVNATTQTQKERGDTTTNTAVRGVEFASHTHTYPFHQNAPSHYLSSDQISRDMLAATTSINNHDSLNDMGPPLSRTLLLAATAAASSADHHNAEGSRPGSGSVQSSNEAPSDVVAHVDTDDCGGSMSEVSQEDHHPGLLLSRNSLELGAVEETGACLEPQNLGDAKMTAVASASGRVSPGGTIYKGKGVRRYQGRYMKLPLKRFHQGEFNETVVQNPLDEGDNDVPAQPPPFDDWSNSGYRSLSRSFSRSISPPPSRSRSRSRSESPRDNMRRRRPSWSPHRDSADRSRPIRNNTRRSLSRSPSPIGRSPPSRLDTREEEGRWRRRQSSPTRNNVHIREREGNDGRWRRDRWNNNSKSRSRSRSDNRASPRRGRKRKGSRSRS